MACFRKLSGFAVRAINAVSDFETFGRTARCLFGCPSGKLVSAAFGDTVRIAVTAQAAGV